MSLRPQEIIRQPSEMEGGGLSGPANSVESIDCGCGRYQLAGLVKFATRRTFIVLLCFIGVIQAASQAYFHVVSSTIARRYNIDPIFMEWVLYMAEIAPILFGIAIAYWGDRIHRASWLGGFTLVQCAAFIACIIPHIPYNKDSEVTTTDDVNVTHLSIYAEESPDLCTRMSSRIFKPNNQEPLVNLIIFIAAQVVNGLAAVTYFALGISYLDDNTKKIHIPVYLGVVVAAKILGSTFGYILGWGFLRIDADNLSTVTSYRDQVGAWWLGWPIFTLLLIGPAFFMAVFPRKLPSEMVEQAASSILEQSGTLRGSQRLATKKVGSTLFLPSMWRLVRNKILILNILSASFLLAGLANFLAKEDIFLESRFQVPKPTGKLLGFGDPLLSRSITTTVKPIIAGLIIIITGYEIARVKPKTRMIVNFSLIMLTVSTIVMVLLAFNSCIKSPVMGVDKGVGSSEDARIDLLLYCNSDCQCSKNAYFRPICDGKSSNTYYSPCHAGCTVVENENGTKTYSNCTCIDEHNSKMNIVGNLEARDGACDSESCQFGWLIYEVAVILVCSAISSTMIGDLLISLRSVNPQDKALTIGFGMAVIGFVAYIPSKIGYDELSRANCKSWGRNSSVCYLHLDNLGPYLCYLTAGLFLISILFKIGVWLFAADLEIFDADEIDNEDEPRELETLNSAQTEPLLQQTPEEESNNNQLESLDGAAEPAPENVSKKLGSRENGPVSDVVGEASGSQPLKYGPVGPGDRRVAKLQSNTSVVDTDDELDSSDGSQVIRKDSVSQVSYKPLELDSDVESELSEIAGRSRKRVSTNIDESRKPQFGVKTPFGDIRFPNPDNYEDPRAIRSSRISSSSQNLAPKVNENVEHSLKQLSAFKGDFNELGIPLVESYQATIKSSTNSLRSPTVMIAIPQLDREPCREYYGETSSVYNPSTRKNDSEEMEENRKFRLENLMQPPIDYTPPVPTSPIRPPSRDQASSGFGSLQDIRERLKLHGETSDSRDSLGSNSSLSGPQKIGSPLCTDL